MGLAPLLQNRILSSLPASEIDQLHPELHAVFFTMQQVLHEVGSAIDDIYFLDSGLISIAADTCDNGLVEVGLTGREGFIGVPALLNPQAIAAHKGFVQIPGAGYRLSVSAFKDAVEKLPVLRERCFQYVHFLMVQTAQTAACNARHELPERLARWLLMSHDRIDGDMLPMKQEFLSYMLGVRRASVSMVANALQADGLIRQSRGYLTILDRTRLEAKACSCYQVIEDSRARILGTS